MHAEGIDRGHFVAFYFTACEEKKLREIEEVASEIANITGYVITATAIDARRDNKKSASKL